MVRSILADRRFGQPAATRAAGRWWLDDLRDWVLRLLRNILHGVDHALGARAPLDAVIGWVVIAAAFALAGYCVYLLVRSVKLPARRRPDGAHSDSSTDAAWGSSALRLAAIAAARAGRGRTAAALLFGAAARALDEGGRVVFDPARTPGEYRRLVNEPAFDAFAADAVVAQFAAGEPRADVFERMLLMYDRMFERKPSAR